MAQPATAGRVPPKMRRLLCNRASRSPSRRAWRAMRRPQPVPAWCPAARAVQGVDGARDFGRRRDTIRVDVAATNTRTPIRVRLTGIQAMEQTVHDRRRAARRVPCARWPRPGSSSCCRRGGKPRPARRPRPVERLAGAMAPRGSRSSSAAAGREVGRILVRRGATPLVAAELGRVRLERRVQPARRAGPPRSGGTCGTRRTAAPARATPQPLRGAVNSTPTAATATTSTASGLRIRNLDPVHDVHLGGWWVRDSALHRYTFPDYATLPPG